MNRPIRSIHDIKGVSLEFPEPIRINAPEPLFVRYLEGRSSRLVVSLAGVGRNRTGEQPPEFTGSASQNGENHVLFIADGSRSWMNTPGVADKMRDQIAQFRDFHGITEIAAIGNSMGAFTTIKLAELMPIDTVIAFAPQYSMHPEVMPEENRWRFFRNRIDRWVLTTLGDVLQPDTNYFMFHADDEMEARHWRRIPSGGHQFIFAEIGHNIANVLRKRQMLPRVIAAAIANKPRKVRKMLQRPRLGRNLGVLRREEFEANFPAGPSKGAHQGKPHQPEVEGPSHDQV